MQSEPKTWWFGAVERLSTLGRWIKAEVKVKFHLFHVKGWAALTQCGECVFFYKEVFISLYLVLPFFPSLKKKCSSNLKLKPSSKLWVSFFPTPLRFCCINNSLFSFALSIAASFGLFSASQSACILQLLKMAFIKPSTDNNSLTYFSTLLSTFLSL